MNIDDLSEWAFNNRPESEAYGNVIIIADDYGETDNERLINLANVEDLRKELSDCEGYATDEGSNEIAVIKGSPAWYHGLECLQAIQEYGVLDNATLDALEYSEISRVVEDELQTHNSECECPICQRYSPVVKWLMLHAIIAHNYNYDGEIWLPPEPNFEAVEEELDPRERPYRLQDLTEDEKTRALNLWGIDPDEARYCIIKYMVMK
jgi:hypothetical protein